MIDTDYLLSALLSAGREGVAASLEIVHSLAQQYAPVRNLFPKPSGPRQRKATQHEMLAISARSGELGAAWRQAISGTPKTMSARQAQRAGYFVSATYPGGFKSRRGRELTSVKMSRGEILKVSKSSTRIGRVNSYSPVFTTQHGRVGGEATMIRAWSGSKGSGTLRAKTIKHGRFSPMKVADLLSSRGRYEVRTGRAVTTTTEGVQIVGGRLRKGIVIEGPEVDGDSIFGFVSASASDPGRNHNYAKDQEFGSRHNAAHPFLRPALRKSRSRILNVERGALSKAFRGGSRPSHGESNSIPFEIAVTMTFDDFSGVKKDFLSQLPKLY